jgi:long-chain fatty acid transport protein
VTGVGRSFRSFSVVLVVLGAGGHAFAAGLSRPNVVGARAIGMGGGFTAIADDPTAVWHNPAGMGIYGDTSVYFGNEIVFTQRSYTPDAQSRLGMAGITTKLTENTAPTYIPIIGLTTRFGFGKTAPTRFAFGLLAYDAYGGSISYDPNKLKNSMGRVVGIANTQILDFEVTPALAYQVSEVLSLGAGLRIGVNAFSVDDTESAFSAKLSGTAVGIGGLLGAMVRPHRMVQIGAVWRSPLNASISGSGDVIIGMDPATKKDFSLKIQWPQSVALGVTVIPHRRILGTIQADWTGWSSVQRLALDVGGLVQNSQMRYLDTYAIHAGVQGVITRFLLVRAGWSIDSNAIPDRTMRRENQDSVKHTLAAGLGLHFWKIFIDGAFEILLPLGSRVVSMPLPSAAAPENETGTYEANVYSIELSAQIRF